MRSSWDRSGFSKLLNPSASRRRTSALPTIPPWPATKILSDLSMDWPLKTHGAKINSTNMAKRSKWTQPCKTFVFLLVNVTTLTARVNSSSGRLPPCTPSVTGRFVMSPIVNTAGMVSPIVASTDPNRMFIERRNCCVLRFHEIATVSHGLDEQKNPVKQQRHHDEKDSLFSGKCWAARRSGEVWQDQAKHCQCHDDVQIGINALEIVILLAIAQPTD